MRKPRFIRQESWRYKRVKENWRKPKGGSSRMRRRMGGLPPLVSVGYGAPKSGRGLHPSGFREVLVYNPSQLEGLNPGSEAVRIASTVGERKRLAILERAESLGLKVLNPPRAAEESASEGAPLEGSER
ncbi:MAG: 50S ribosomal protein L32e [Candidatus Bathyarchaeia archaeon]